MPTVTLTEFLHQRSKLVEGYLKKHLPKRTLQPRKLHEAMRYSVEAGGKRLRPILVLVSAEIARGSDENALPAAAAVECIHTYSLIHDDLPCMDDDELRRGKLTCHKAFGEAVALLAGDALLTAAFGFLAKVPAGRRYDVADYVRTLADAAGSTRLIGGQVADMEAENVARVSSSHLRRIHSGKTAAMIAASLRLGAMSAQAPEDDVEALAAFGEDLGLAFQIIDDILDATQSSQILGKSAGKDAVAGKATYPSVFGLKAARVKAEKITKRSLSWLEHFGGRAHRLREIAEHLLHRKF